MKKYLKKHIGKKTISNQGYEIKIIDGGTQPGYVTIKFEEPQELIKEVQFCSFKKKEINNPFYKNNQNLGYIGIGNYNSKKNKKHHNAWSNMLKRCYDKKNIKFKDYGAKGIKVCDEWLNFQNFAKWFEDNYIEGFELDKDLLSNENNKIYSPETCCFLPKEINKIIALKKNISKSGYPSLFFDKRDKKYYIKIYCNKSKKELTKGYLDPKEAWKIYKKHKIKRLKYFLKLYFNDFKDKKICMLIYKNLKEKLKKYD